MIDLVIRCRNFLVRHRCSLQRAYGHPDLAMMPRGMSHRAPPKKVVPQPTIGSALLLSYRRRVRMKILYCTTLISLATAMLTGADANAAMAQLTVNDASQIKFVVHTDNKVYVRNLNQFDSAWAGCCYAFWMDLSTDSGRAQYAAFLSAYFSRQKITLLADTAGGAFIHVGSF
jgi:hypothetical protein